LTRGTHIAEISLLKLWFRSCRKTQSYSPLLVGCFNVGCHNKRSHIAESRSSGGLWRTMLIADYAQGQIRAIVKHPKNHSHRLHVIAPPSHPKLVDNRRANAAQYGGMMVHPRPFPFFFCEALVHPRTYLKHFCEALVHHWVLASRFCFILAHAWAYLLQFDTILAHDRTKLLHFCEALVHPRTYLKHFCEALVHRWVWALQLCFGLGHGWV
jgi:hypothetical protein